MYETFEHQIEQFRNCYTHVKLPETNIGFID